jgi:membrane fusion protein
MNDQTAFLESDPPHWAARGLSLIIIVMFALLLIAAAVVHVPETVTGRFTLVPITGTDPVRTSRDGIVASVRAHEGDSVARGATLFLIRSSSANDRTADRRTLESQSRANTERLLLIDQQYRGARRADSAEARRLQSRAAYLERQINSKTRRLAVMQEIADSSQSGFDRGAMGRVEVQRLELDARSLNEEVEAATNDLAETRADIARLAQTVITRQLEYRQARGAIEESLERDAIRASSISRDPVSSSDSGFALVAPCAGTTLRLRVNAPGAVVREGDTLAEVACNGAPLQGELTLPQAGVPLVQKGQGVKLRFDAFPYQRYGVRFGTVRWLGPAGLSVQDSGAFRAIVDLSEASIRVRGRMRPLLPGMGGQADIVVGRRSLVSYAFEPLRALKESFADAPADSTK